MSMILATTIRKYSNNQTIWPGLDFVASQQRPDTSYLKGQGNFPLVKGTSSSTSTSSSTIQPSLSQLYDYEVYD